MTLLQAIALVVRVRDLLPLRSASAQVCASTPEESYDRASPFRGRKSRLRADCCKTSAPPARDARPDRRWLAWSLIQIARERYVLRSAAGWRSPRSAEKTVPPAFHFAREKRQSFVPPRCVAESRRRDPECAE